MSEMKRTINIALLALVFVFATSHAQKRKIIVNEGLLENSTELKVKSKHHKKSMEFRCADYEIVDSEIKYGKIEEVHLPGTKEQSRHDEFWFLMKNGIKQTIKVKSIYDRKSRFEDKSDFLDLITGEDDTYELTNFESFHTATFTINLDTLNRWILNDKHLHNTDAKECNVTLTNGTRAIEVVDAKPLKGGTYYWTSPSTGFEFIENGQSIAAYQSQGGAAIGMGSKRQLIWIRNNLDDDTKLLLIAVMAAL